MFKQKLILHLYWIMWWRIKMTNRDLAEKIYDTLNSKGANLGKDFIFTIKDELDKHNPEKEWQKLALEGLKSQATKALWHEDSDKKGRNVGDVIRRVEAYMTENKVESKEG